MRCPASLLAILPLLALGALSAAEFNARVSDREIALNETVRVNFTTIKPQRPEIDIAQALRTALAIPAVRDHWRLEEPPSIERHEKIKDVGVTLILRPRHPGDLLLPEIPIPWLNGDRRAAFGTIAVMDEITAGSDTAPLPPELEAVGGYQWGSTQETILERDRRNEVVSGDSGTTVIATPSGLRLILSANLLTEATLDVADIPLDAAAASFTGRWGLPVEDSDTAHRWLIGWLAITATAAGDGTRLHFVHEGIRRRATSNRIQDDVFAVLSGRGEGSNEDEASGDGAGSEATDEVEIEPETESEAEAAASDTDADAGPSEAEIEAEARRALQRPLDD